MKLIAGLGNPGFLYARNRHNIGFMCVSQLARKHDIRFDRTQCHARTGTGWIAGQRVVLARPQAYMNASGASVNPLLKKLNITPADLIVIHDDLDLPPGKVRIRFGVGWTGHKGVRSVRNELGSGDFTLLRVGIGRPDLPVDFAGDKEAAIVAYVLSDFTDEERKIISLTIPRVGEAVACLLGEGLEAAMNKYN